jgi:acyl carrier protein
MSQKIDENIFYDEMSQILEIDKKKIIKDNYLNKFSAWDSLGMMTFIIRFKDKTTKKIDPVSVGKCKKISDLKKLIF